MANFNKKQAKKAVSAADKQAAKTEQARKKVEQNVFKKGLSVKKVGPLLDIDEFNDLKTQLGSDVGIADFAASKGIKLDPVITNPPVPKEEKEGDPAEIPDFKSSTAEGDTPAVFDYKKGLDYINAQGNINTNIRRLETESDNYIAGLQYGAAENIATTQAGAEKYAADQALAGEGVRSGTTKYVADQGLAGENVRASTSRYLADQELAGENVRAGTTKYVADQGLAGENVRASTSRYLSDRQLESDLGVENIRAKGAIDLQGIINAGASNVETIRGEYGLKGKQIDRNTAMFNSLISSFNF